MIFDHEDGNWKNSEVARTMLEILASQTPPPSESQQALAVDVELEDRLLAEAHDELNALHRTGASHLIINELNRIAELVGDNSRAALEIELAIDDIKQILK
jgi:LytS/YehU family sensor histidine kinase